MQIIIPMAGRGKRFERAGYPVPKPLIAIDGKPMIAHVLNLFPGEENVLLLCNAEHLSTSTLQTTLSALRPSATILRIPSHDLGPVPTVLEAEKYIKDDEPVIVSYCDYNTHWNYQTFKRHAAACNNAGIIVCYRGFHPHLLGPNLYASVETDEHNRALEIREKYSFTKNKMDSWQSCGMYYFQSGSLLKAYFRRYRERGEPVNGEYYVSMVYDLLIKNGLPVSVYPIDVFAQWGTPEDLAEYQYWSECLRPVWTS